MSTRSKFHNEIEKKVYTMVIREVA